MTRHVIRAAACTAALVLGLAAPHYAHAQVPAHGVGAAAGLEHYIFGDDDAAGIRSLSLFTAPFAVRVAFAPATLELAGAFARGALTRPDGSSATITGLTDTSLRLGVPVVRDRLTLFGAVVLPTGQARQTLEEAEVAGAIAADLLPFRVSNWGTGGGVDVSVALALPVSGFGVGLRLGYALAREFEPLEEQDFTYQPGDQFYAGLAVDRVIGYAGKASVQLTYQRFQDDALGGRNLYRAGDRVQLVGSYAFAVGAASSGVAYAGVMHRSRGAYIGSTGEAPAQDLILAGGGIRIPTARALLLPGADLRIFRSADGVGQGYVIGLGGSVELPLGTGGLLLVPNVRGRLGKLLVREGSESGFTGFEIGAGLRWGGRP